MIYIDVQYHKNVNDQFFVFVQSSKFFFEKIEKIKTKTKNEKSRKKKQKRLNSIDNEKKKIIIEYRCIDFLCSNYKFNENVENYCYFFNQNHYKIKQKNIDD